MTKTVQRLIALTALVALAFVPAVNAGAKGKKRHESDKVTVRIHDNYYEPAKLKVDKGTTVVWKWPVVTGDSHDVTLDEAPKRVRKFQSPVAAAQFKYKRKLRKPGKYHIICTLHEEMTMDIVVRRR